MKAKLILKQLLPALALIGLMIGCGGDKGDKKPAGGDKKETLAEFLPGKRLYVEVDMSKMREEGSEEGSDDDAPEDSAPSAPKESPEDPDGIDGEGETLISTAGGGPPEKMLFVLQFEKDGKLNAGMDMGGGKVMSMEDDLTYKVSGPMKVTIFENGKADGGVTFPTAHPKEGDKIMFGPDDQQMPGTITKIGDASPMESGPGGGGDENDPTDDPTDDPDADSADDPAGKK